MMDDVGKLCRCGHCGNEAQGTTQGLFKDRNGKRKQIPCCESCGKERECFGLEYAPHPAQRKDAPSKGSPHEKG